MQATRCAGHETKGLTRGTVQGWFLETGAALLKDAARAAANEGGPKSHPRRQRPEGVGPQARMLGDQDLAGARNGLRLPAIFFHTSSLTRLPTPWPRLACSSISALTSRLGE
jgi:hypothetical protein